MSEHSPTTAAGARLPVIEGVLIFEATWAGSIAQKCATLGFAGMFWTIWLSLWLPVATFFIWGAAPIWGVSQALDHPEDALTTLGLIVVSGVAMGAFLGLWGTIQMVLGRGDDRPVETPSVTLEDLASSHKVDEAMLRRAWQSRRLVIHHDAQGAVTDMELSLRRQFQPVLIQGGPPAPLEPEPTSEGAPPLSSGKVA